MSYVVKPNGENGPKVTFYSNGYLLGCAWKIQETVDEIRQMILDRDTPIDRQITKPLFKKLNELDRYLEPIMGVLEAGNKQEYHSFRNIIKKR